MKSLPFISSKQSNDRSLFARCGTALIICLGFFLAKSSIADNPAGNTTGPVVTPAASYTNYGTIASSATGATGINSTGTAASISINNSGTISMTGSGLGTNGIQTNNNSGTTTTVTNSGAITAANGITLKGTGDTFTNSAAGNIAITNGGNGVNVLNNNQTVTNNGVISGSGSYVWGVYVDGGTSGATINNAKSISVSGVGAVGILVGGNAPTKISNTGTISATGTGAYGIQNDRSISTLNNAQSGLTYTGVLPTNYNIIVNSATSFGTLNAGTVNGSSIFGINAGSTLTAGTYNNVLQNIGNGNGSVNSSYLSGTYGGNYSWNLVQWDPGYWNLVVAALNNGGGDNSGGGGGSSGGSSSSCSGTNNLSGSISAVSGCTGNVQVVKTGAVIYGNSLSGTVSSAPTNTNVVFTTGTVVTGTTAVTNYGTTEGITNNAILAGSSYGIVNAADATIINLTNNGIISGGTAGIQNLSPHTINLLVNTGTILGGIDNTQGRIITLVNSQGGTIPLALSGNLPNNYQVIINGLSSYGQLALVNPVGQMTFGITSNSVLYSGLTYTAVLSGVTAANLLNTSGIANNYFYKLNPESDTSIYDLTIGASISDTQSSLQSTTNSLQYQFGTQQNAVIIGLTYDCNNFGANGVCISAGARGSSQGNFLGGTTSALVIGGYKLKDNIRIGAYLDQNLSASNPNGVTQMSNSTPMGGVFGVWSYRTDGTGAEVKASLGYNQKGMTVTRPVVGTSEPGSGGTNLISQGGNIIAKYGFALDNRTIVAPYVGMRYMTTKMGGYSEGASSSVQNPLAYSSMSMNATTALAGANANYRLDETWSFLASAGVEADTQTTNGSYTVTNYGAFKPVSLNNNPNNIRPTATLAAYYALDKNAQIAITGIYRQDSFTGVASTTGLVTYTIGM